MTFLFDTHCHFDSIQDAKEQLPRAYEQGVRVINVIGCDIETTRRSLDVVEMVANEGSTLGIADMDVKATMGLHPHDARLMDEQKLELEKLLENNNDFISGIGETGYDFYYNHSSTDDQTRSFIWQIELAKKYNKAMVVHTRDAWDETFSLLDDQGWPEKTVLHCFTGGPTEASRCVDNGAYISISGISTFKNAQDIRDAIETTPLERLLCETDAPWLAPAPHRGKPNEPSYVSLVADQIVKIRVEKCDEEPDQVMEALLANGLKVFR